MPSSESFEFIGFNLKQIKNQCVSVKISGCFAVRKLGGWEVKTTTFSTCSTCEYLGWEGF